MFLSRVVCAAVLTCFAMACGSDDASQQSQIAYPLTRKSNVVDDYHGTKVADPYRWMEALDSKDVAEWVAASNAITEEYLERLPLRTPFRTRLTELWNYPRVGVPVVENGRLFYS